MKFSALIAAAALSYFVWAKVSPLNPAQENQVPSKNEFKHLLESEKNSINIYKNVSPSVVNIKNIALARRGFWDFDSIEVPRGAGTGFVWNTDGYIVTNFHVIQSGDRFKVSFKEDKTTYEASIVGADPQNDIAILKLQKFPKKLTPISIGHSKDLHVGQKALAIGNPFGLDQTMTVGTISALGRKIDGIGGVKIHDMIQTDASINPGNSGGPLLNSSGEVIGMNTVIFSSSGSSAGVGFAVPADTIRRIVPELIKKGKVSRPKLGIILLPDHYLRYFNVKKGIVIKSVVPGGPAEKTGLKGIRQDNWGEYYLGDVITKVGGKEVNNFDDIFHVLDRYKPGDKVEIEYLSGNKSKKTKIELYQ